MTSGVTVPGEGVLGMICSGRRRVERVEAFVWLLEAFLALLAVAVGLAAAFWVGFLTLVDAMVLRALRAVLRKDLEWIG